MLNQIILVGRLVKSPEVTETESGKKMSYITLAIPRSFKNADGEYDTDLLIVCYGKQLQKTLLNIANKEI